MGGPLVPAPLCIHSGHHQQDLLMLFEKWLLAGGSAHVAALSWFFLIYLFYLIKYCFYYSTIHLVGMGLQMKSFIGGYMETYEII